MLLSVRKAIELTISLFAFAILALAGCGGGSTSPATPTPTPPPPPAATVYTTSAGVGEVLQFSIDTTSLTYTYTVTKTSYAASGVSAGQTGSGSLTGMSNGFYLAGTSSDNFIQGGKLYPASSGLLVGHVRINTIGGSEHIPVFGFTSPVTTLADLSGTYNFAGFFCNARGIANVGGNALCGTNYGTISIDGSGNVTKCNRGDITTDPSTNPCQGLIQTRTLQVVNTSPGVFDFRDATTNGHVGWFLAFTAANGQKVAVIDHDDVVSNLFGHTILSTRASTTAGTIDGNYFKKDNEGGERVVAISGVDYTNDQGFTGSINYNSPWAGMSTFQVASGALSASGIGMTSGTGVYANTLNADPALFGVGVKY